MLKGSTQRKMLAYKVSRRLRAPLQNTREDCKQKIRHTFQLFLTRLLNIKAKCSHFPLRFRTTKENHR